MADMELTAELQMKLAEPVAALGLEIRTIHILEKAGVFSVEDLLSCCPRRKVDCDQYLRKKNKRARQDNRKLCDGRLHLLDLANFGEKTLEHLFERLAEAGFCTS